MVSDTQNWTPDSWTSKKIKQIPVYDDKTELKNVLDEISQYPPLVTSWEVEGLKQQLKLAEKGEAFLLQGGDCAETYDLVTSTKIVNILKVLLQMSLVLIHEMKVPVIRVGRLAGQYAKPRSNESETVNGQEIPIYRGDLFNRIEASASARRADPRRLLEGYQKSALTLNFVRALTEGGGFADLHHPEYWELNFMKSNPYYEEYRSLAHSISNAVQFVESISPGKMVTLKKVRIYTSHEALNLYYETAQTRKVPHRTGFYNLSGHMVWVGNRTRDLDGAHIEYLRGIENPIGIKVGPPFEIDTILKIIEQLNPENDHGKIVMITRFGMKNVESGLPPLVRAVRDAGLNVVWSCDPMHGNTFSTTNSYKSRKFDDILNEIRATFAIHRSEGTHLGGVHLELTGDNVTECVGGSMGLGEDQLNLNYETYCDPRLNYEQSLEMAFELAREWKLGS
jgi:3-deoxy-7-phosphoheptulonate synthase